MSREDAPVPADVPRKRRQIEKAPDVWIATWLGRDDLAMPDRRRLEDEKRRRKLLRTHAECRVGLLVGEEGMTVMQVAEVLQVLRERNATHLMHNRLPRRTHGTLVHACRDMDVALWPVDGGHREVIEESHAVVAAAKESTVQPYATPGVWAGVGLARHRGVPATVVFPNGNRQEAAQ